MMSEHFKTVCQYGYVHSQCRCMVANKSIKSITCDRASHKENPLNSTQGQGPTFKVNTNPFEYVGLNGLRDYIHNTAVEKGWWDQQRELGTILMLCVSELSEALEEYRAGHPPTEVYCKHGDINGPHYPGTACKPEGVPVELADTIIRILDLCGHLNIDIQAVLHQKMMYNDTRSHRHGGKVV